MSPENGKIFELPPKWTLLIVVEKNGDQELVPMVIDRFGAKKDDITQFVIITVSDFSSRLEDLKKPIFPLKPGGGRRSKREMSDIAESRAHEINRIEEGLKILTGQRKQAIKIIRNSHDAEILG